MKTLKKIKHSHVNFESSKIIHARKIVEQDINIISKKLDETLISFQNAYDKGNVLVGIFETPCGMLCIFVEHKGRQLISPFYRHISTNTAIH